MPTYDYQCHACDHQFEEFQRITAKPLVKCPACGKRKLRRLFGTGAAVVFKGSGFYQTDYRSDSYKKGADAAKQAGKSSQSDKSSSDSKASDTKSTDTKSSGTKSSGSGQSTDSNRSASDSSTTDGASPSRSLHVS